MPFFSQMFGEAGLTPHGFCLLWQPALIWLHVFSDTVIGLSYYAIPLGLAYFVWKRQDIAFGWIFWMFAAFIFACGTTHFVEVWTLWHPDYGIQGLVKLVTAAISLATAVLLWPLIPRLVELPSRKQLGQANEELHRQIQQRNEALERLRQSEEQRRLEERHRLLLESVADYSIVMLDPQGCVTNWSTGAERIKGDTTQEIAGQHFSVFYPPEDQAHGLPLQELEIAAREGRFETEAWRMRKDGSRFWASVVIHPVTDEAGQLVRFANVMRDITARRQHQEELQRIQAASAQSQKMEAVGQLTGGIAHDFNNLLTAVLGNIEILEQDGQKDAQRFQSLLRAARHAAERGALLTQRLLAFSRRQALQPQSVDINRVVSTTSELLRSTLGEQIKIETVLAGGIWRAFIDTNQLESALLNLAVNARDAMPSGGKLTIETGNAHLDEAYSAAHAEVAPGQYVLLAVTDNGTGMSEETVARAFEPFFTTKPPEKGTGLGLSQIYGFIKQSSGHIKIYSELGAGTTVKIYLPRYLGAEGPGFTTPAEPEMTRHPRTVLLVEDDDDVREYIVSALIRLGYRALEAGDASAALTIMDSHPEVNLLLTDVGLPGLNGRQLAAEASRRLPGVKILFITGYARNAIVHNGVLDHGVELLSKPFTIDHLARKLNQVLQSANSH
jgi:PAS domain S-box-containing protein